MKSELEHRLAALAADSGSVLVGGRKGIEREALRVGPDGMLATTPHPAALGSALTNPYITTDFSEALLEFVTPAYTTTWEALRVLLDIHQFAYSKLDDELLWAASMPCGIPGDDSEIPLANYGTSNVGQMKTVYRRGLGYRYGRRMQTIAGVHFNYSLPDPFWPVFQQVMQESGDPGSFRSERYMGLVRNFRRTGWLLLYLFGASPALCKSFGDGQQLRLDSLNERTWFAPFGTSLRMSDLGYNNQTQSRLAISLNSIDEYIRDLSAAIRTPEPKYEAVGVKVGGEYRQLNANVLQIENEYYSPIRPKRVIRSGERPTAALRRGGVEYVEIRLLDLNLFDPCGINQNTMRFIEAYLVYCLLTDSPPLDDEGLEETKFNQAATARRGRDPALRLRRDRAEVSLADWAREIIDDVGAVAETFELGGDKSCYREAVEAMRELIDDPELTPSARIISDLREQQLGFFDYTMSIASGHRDYFSTIDPPNDQRLKVLDEAARESVVQQQAIEEADDLSFDEYLERYYAKSQ
ncbi:MAG: glutamate--cysteine ligase [Pseudomonadota bacterium]